MNEKRFNRKELYDLVWTDPLTVLEKTYNISANELRNICKKLQIPLPKSGHWMKIQFGKIVPREPLLENSNIEQEVLLQSEKEGNESNLVLPSPKMQLRKKIEKEYSSILTVPEHLTKPDLLIEQARKVLTNRNPHHSRHIGLVNGLSEGILDITVSVALISRSLRLMDTIIKILRACGYAICIENRKTLVIIQDEKVEISLREKMKRVPVKGQYSFETSEFNLTGILIFKIRISYDDKEWCDGKLPLEQQISKIIATMELMAKERHEQRLVGERNWKIREEERLKREAIEKRKAIELQKFKELLKEAKRWQDAKMLRDYIASLENDIVGSSSNPEVRERIEWAKQKANWYDPLINSNDELLEAVIKNEV